ncbi:sperm acrosome membrane-associated protein 6 isoform X3 [Talpa occidentalis]|uniref:sperm acrosome membrane-associated protein 6 isoform X3 n=1 Tax=Talpa occidentalis TaxID=50954 RepID=UPI00188EFE5D|nr:sperm acrosome membrane-associated protein 6 isoform X3 [Talpa occidentalis]
MAPMAPAALVALAALGTPAWACFFCLTTHQDRLRICQIFSGWNAKVTDNCYRRLLNTFKPTEKAEINYHELSRLHDNFTQIVLKLEDIASYSRGFIMAFLSAKEKALEAIAELKPPQDCVPPCGFQELARRFRCSGCYSYICDYPLDCPGRDGDSGRAGHVLLLRELPAAPGGRRLLLEVRSGDPDSGPVVLPGLAARRRPRGAGAAGAAHAPRDLLLRDPARRLPRGAALLLPQRDGPATARGDRAPGDLSGGAAVGPARRGLGEALEPEPRRAAGQARRPDARKQGAARGRRRPGVSERDAAGVGVLSMVLQRQQPTEVTFSSFPPCF